MVRATAGTLTVLLALAACGAAGHARRKAAGPARTAAATTQATATTQTTVTTRTTTAARHKPPAPAPGDLPQTDELPSSQTRAFHAEMAGLWAAIRTDAPGRGLKAFFPEPAYMRLKAIGDAAADYTGRLLADYRLDIEAAHALLGAGAATAHLEGVEVPSAHWVDPGACYNSVGYYEVPNSRIVYGEGGTTRSFGIASMISWRGVWYVIHLGAILRSADAGVVDDPSQGAGVSIPSSTC